MHKIIIGLVIGLVVGPAAAQQGYIHQAAPPLPYTTPYTQPRSYAPPTLPPSSPGLMIPDPPPVKWSNPPCIYGCTR